MRLKSIGVVSFGTTLSIVYGGLGLIFGAIFSFFALFGLASGFDSNIIGAMMGVGAIIIFPLLYGFFGFFIGCLTAWIYNLAAGWTGGIDMNFDSNADSPSQPTY